MRFFNHFYRIFPAFIGAAIISAPFLSCTHSNKGDRQESVSTIYTPRYASGFRIDSLPDGSKQLVTLTPWQGAKNNPITATIPRECKRIGIMSGTFLAMLDELGEENRVVAVSSLPFVYNKQTRSRLDSEADFGYEGNINYERILALHPDLMVIYSTGGTSAMENKLRELNIPFIYFGDYVEESPLGKAEWIVAMAEIVGNRRKGEIIFNAIAEAYNQEKERLAKNPPAKKPKVMVNAPYGDSWFCPPSDSYAVTLINDAGGDYLLKEFSGNASRTIDMEKGIELGEKADFWLNPGSIDSKKTLKANVPQLAGSKVLRRGRVYCNNRRSTPEGGNDYFESGTVRPDLILSDLSRIFSSFNSETGEYSVIDPDSLYFYRLIN